VHERSGGNPFFTRQFLRALVDDGLLLFDSATRAWRWDLAGARERAFSESVTDLMADRLGRQPEETRVALRIASCVGAAFAPRILAAVLGRPEAEITVALRVAEDEGLVSAPVPGGDQRWRFVHDRMQQAAYALIVEGERASLRGRIGRVMREQLTADELDDALFEVVANLAEGGTRGMSAEAARDFGALNLTAGDRARTSLAYEDAHAFLLAGLSAIEGLPDCKDLEFRTRAALFECAYLTARFEEAERLLSQLLREAPDVTTRARILNTKIVIDTAQGRSVEAVRLGIETAHTLGVRIPEHPSLPSVLWGLTRVQLALRGRHPDKLRSLPHLTDPQRVAAIGILLRIGPAAYFNNPGAFLLCNLGIVRISLRHGHAAGSSFGYIIYAMVLGAKLRNASLGHEFGRLAIELSDRLDPPDIRPKIYLIYGAFVVFWKRPYQEGIRALADAFVYATEAGDLQYASYCQQSTVFLRVAFGAPVDDILAQTDRYLAFAHQAKDEFPIETLTIMRQRVRALCGQTAALNRLDGEGFDETAWAARTKAGGNLTTLGYYQTAKVALSWLAGDVPTALAYGAQGFDNLDALLSQIHTAEICLYYGLALATARRDPQLAPRVSRKHLAACRRMLARRAADCPENFECWHLLLEATASEAGEEGHLTQYDGAIGSAKRHAQPHIAAMAAEAVARSQAAAGRRTVAEGYLKEALAGYDHWRATAKAAALVSEFADLLPDRALSQLVRSGSVQRASVRVAIENAMLEARKLSSEPDLDLLLERLLGLALSSTGADRGQVLLRRPDGLATFAEADAERGSSTLAAPVPLVQATAVCTPLVQAVIRRRAPVVLADAASDSQFGATPYVKRVRPRAIACVPITIGNEVEGALYLENTQTPGVFTPERERLLGVMAGEVAVAVERARLANAARESREALGTAMRRVEVLEKAKAHLGKFVPASVQRIIDANPDAPALQKRERDVTILFLDIESYSALTESLPRERLDWLVRTYFSRFLDVVHAHRGEVNETAGDGLMILFQDDDPAVHAVNACRAAVAIGRACRALNAQYAGQVPPVTVNVGINSGASLVGSTRLQGAGDARWTFTATGAVTNIAARLGAYATKGAIVVSEATARRIGREFMLYPLGAQPLKNIRDPVVLFQLLDQGAQR
jgi:class 3 adenylate cyclase